jgi:5'-nucleotidase
MPALAPAANHNQPTDPEQPITVMEGTSSKGRSLLLVHTNDTHSCIEPLSPLLSDTAQADKGGYLRRVALIDQLRKSDPDLLLVDAGDFSQGSAYYSLYHGDVEVGLMNLMGYDAATIGNHEFDWGTENMARIFRQAQFPIVCCNYDFTSTPVEGLVKPYTIVRRAGLKIGLLGVSPQLEGLVAAHTCEGVRYTDPIVAAQPVADYLRNVEHCDLVVCISHLGWKVAGVSDEELIAATRNIDIVIGGHSHTYFRHPEVLENLDGHAIIDNQMGKNARFVGTLRLHFNRATARAFYIRK